MAKKSSKSGNPKAAKKPAAKASEKVAPKKSTRPAPKPAKKSSPKPKATSKPAAKPKSLAKPVKKTVATPEKGKIAVKSKQVVKSKSVNIVKPIVKKEEVKIKSKPELKAPKALISKEIKPAVTPPAPPVSKNKKVVAPPLPPPPSNLPKLPKGFVLKKQKGKLAPGEKRLFKTNVITHHVISEIPLSEIEKKSKPEPKGKFELEYIIHTPVTLLYDFLTTPNGLAEWFADGVDMKNDVYTFDWDGQKQNAQIISAKIDSYLRLRWLDKAEGSYFEFRLSQDELTNEVSLTITDFADGDDDLATSRRLWDSQIQRLVKALGTY